MTRHSHPGRLAGTGDYPLAVALFSPKEQATESRRSTSIFFIMPKGFAAKQQSKDQYIQNFFKTSKQLLSGFQTPEEAMLHHRKAWFNQFIDKNNDYSVEQLLNPELCQLETIINPKSSVFGSHKIALIGFNGMWRVLIHERPDKSLDFDIAVHAGSNYRFHSEVIRHSILSRFGRETYDQWRKMVKSDIRSLKQLIRAIKGQINSVPWSYTCSLSSARLCEQVGVSTHRGTAFLFPDSYA